jgi:DNA-binding NarL/FixJ family response regulator
MTRLALATRQSEPTRLISQTTITDSQGALRLVANRAVDAVALRLPLREAMAMMPRLRRLNPKLIVLLVSEDRGEKVKRQALRAGIQALVRPESDLESQVGILESVAETVRLVAINQKLTKQILESARSLDAALQRSAEIVRSGRNRRAP